MTQQLYTRRELLQYAGIAAALGLVVSPVQKVFGQEQTRGVATSKSTSVVQEPIYEIVLKEELVPRGAKYDERTGRMSGTTVRVIGTFRGTKEELQRVYASQIKPNIPNEFERFYQGLDLLIERLRRDPFYLLRNAINIYLGKLLQAQDGQVVPTDYVLDMSLLHITPQQLNPPTLERNIKLKSGTPSEWDLHSNSGTSFIVDALVSKDTKGTAVKIQELDRFSFEGGLYEKLADIKRRNPYWKKMFGDLSNKSDKELDTLLRSVFGISERVIDPWTGKPIMVAGDDYLLVGNKSSESYLRRIKDIDPKYSEKELVITSDGPHMTKLDLTGRRQKLEEALRGQVIRYDRNWRPVFKR